MTIDLNIPDDAVRYIMYQRTTLINDLDGSNLTGKFISKFFPSYHLKRSVEEQAVSRASEIKTLYAKDMADEYAAIKDHLPENCTSVLDIGCGVAGIDVFIFHHYGAGDGLNFYLLDKTDVNSKVYYSFNKEGAFYNSLSTARSLLTSNGIHASKIHTMEVTEDSSIETSEQIDLVISLISWGFHYPVSTYLERVYEILSPGGSLILDVRKDTGGVGEVDRRFGNITVITNFKKYQRILAVK